MGQFQTCRQLSCYCDKNKNIQEKWRRISVKKLWFKVSMSLSEYHLSVLEMKKLKLFSQSHYFFHHNIYFFNSDYEQKVSWNNANANCTLSTFKRICGTTILWFCITITNIKWIPPIKQKRIVYRNFLEIHFCWSRQSKICFEEIRGPPFLYLPMMQGWLGQALVHVCCSRWIISWRKIK